MVATIRTGLATPTNGLDKFLITNSLDYYQVVKTAYLNAGLKPPTNIYGDPHHPPVPAYTSAPPSTRTGAHACGRPWGAARAGQSQRKSADGRPGRPAPGRAAVRKTAGSQRMVIIKTRRSPVG